MTEDYKNRLAHDRAKQVVEAFGSALGKIPNSVEIHFLITYDDGGQCEGQVTKNEDYTDSASQDSEPEQPARPNPKKKLNWLRKILPFLACLPLLGASTTIDCGSSTDSGYTGGTAQTISGSTLPDTTVRFSSGPPFSYRFVVTGPTQVTLRFTALPQFPNSVFSVSINNLTVVDDIDLVAEGGLTQIIERNVIVSPDGAGVLKIVFSRKVGAAVVSSITLTPLQDLISTSAPTVTPTLVRATSTQALFTYPEQPNCTWKVSELPDFSTLVHDVDPALFPGSDQAARPGNVLTDGIRFFLLGKRATEQGNDGKKYSRALPAATTLYYDACGTRASFQTATIPLGSTYADLPPTVIPTLEPGVPVVDDQTGAVTKLIAPNSNHFNNAMAILGFGGAKRVCNQDIVGPDNGYFCFFPTEGGNPAAAYYYVPASGEFRYLGNYLTDNRPGPNGYDSAFVAYPMGRITYYTVGTRNGGTALLKGTYAGDYKAVPPKTVLNMTWESFGPKTILQILQDFNPAVQSSVPCGFKDLSGDKRYLYVDCGRPPQNNYSEAGGVIDTTTGKAIAARNMMAEPPMRFCGEHAYALGAPDVPVITLANHGLEPPFTYTVTLAGPVDAITTTFAFTADVQGPASGIPMKLIPGDLLQLAPDTELVRIKTRLGPAQFEVIRGWGGFFPAKPHKAGDTGFASCWASGKDGGTQSIFWKYLEDPLGASMIVSDWPEDHDDMGPNLHVVEGWGANIGPILDHLADPPSTFYDNGPTFDGARAQVAGNAAAMHPSYHQSTVGWFTDSMPFNGGNLLSGEHTLVSGSLWKYGGAQKIDRKILPTLSITGGTAMRDISGPSSFIADDATAGLTYCFSGKDAECRPDAKAGDIYGNVPGLIQPRCQGSDQPNPTYHDWCVSNSPSLAQSVLQIGVENNTNGSTSRRLSRGFGGARNIGIQAKPTPDAKWVMFASLGPNGAAGNGLLAAKSPLFQADSVDRSTFYPLPVEIPPTALPADVEFGYAEFADPSKRQCSSRLETCVAILDHVDPVNPFFYRSETGGINCSSGCRIVVPVAPEHAVYYRVGGKEYIGLAP